MEQNAFSVGTRIDCLYEGNTDKIWYPGRIAAVKVTEWDACVYEIQYDDGEVEYEVVQDYIRSHEYGTICCGTRVAGNYAASGDWYTGTITEVQDDGRYTIRYEDGEEEVNVTLDRIREFDDKKLEEEHDGAKLEMDRIKLEEEMTITYPHEEISSVDIVPHDYVEPPINSCDNSSFGPIVPVTTAIDVPANLMGPYEPSEPHGTVPPSHIVPSVTLTPQPESPDEIHDSSTQRDAIVVEEIPENPPNSQVDSHPPTEPCTESLNGPNMSHPQASSMQPTQPLQTDTETRDPPADVKEHLMSCLQQLHEHSVDIQTTKSLVSQVVQYSRSYPHATADILHSCNGASLLLDLLVANGSQAIVLCYCLVLLRRFCFLSPSNIEYFSQNDIIPTILYTMASFPEDAIVQASASGAIAAFLGPISGDIQRLETLLDLIFKSLYHHKTYSIHTRQVYFHSSQVLMELSQLGGNESIACLIWVKVCQKTNKMLDSIPFLLMLLYLKQALPAQDYKTIGTVGRFLTCIVTKYSHAVRLLQYYDGMNVLSAVLAIINEEEGMQQIVATAFDAIVLAKKQYPWPASGAEMGSPSKISSQAHMRQANTRSNEANAPSSRSLFPAAFPQSNGQYPSRVEWDASWNLSRKASDSLSKRPDKVSQKHPSCVKEERQRLLMATYGMPQKDKLDCKRKRSNYASNVAVASRSRPPKVMPTPKSQAGDHPRNSVTKNQRLMPAQNDTRGKQTPRTTSQKPQLKMTSSSLLFKTTKMRGPNQRSESLSHHSDSLSQYAKNLFQEQQSSLTKERLSFAEKLHRMIDRAQSSETTKGARQQTRPIPSKRPTTRSNTIETKSLRPNNTAVKDSKLAKPKKYQFIEPVGAQRAEPEVVQEEAGTELESISVQEEADGDLPTGSLEITADPSIDVGPPETSEQSVEQEAPVIEEGSDVKETEGHAHSTVLEDEPANEAAVAIAMNPTIQENAGRSSTGSEDGVIDFIEAAISIAKDEEENTSPHSQGNLDAFYDDEDFEWGSMTNDLPTEKAEFLEDAIKTSVEVGDLVPQIASTFVNGILSHSLLANSLCRESHTVTESLIAESERGSQVESDQSVCISAFNEDRWSLKDNTPPGSKLMDKPEGDLRLDAILEENEEVHHVDMNEGAHIEADEHVEQHKEPLEETLVLENAIESQEPPPLALDEVDEYSEEEDEVDQAHSLEDVLEEGSNKVEDHVEEGCNDMKEAIDADRQEAPASDLEEANEYSEEDEVIDRIQSPMDYLEDTEGLIENEEAQIGVQEPKEVQTETLREVVGLEPAIESKEPLASAFEARDSSDTKEKVDQNANVDNGLKDEEASIDAEEPEEPPNDIPGVVLSEVVARVESQDSPASALALERSKVQVRNPDDVLDIEAMYEVNEPLEASNDTRQVVVSVAPAIEAQEPPASVQDEKNDYSDVEESQDDALEDKEALMAIEEPAEPESDTHEVMGVEFQTLERQKSPALAVALQRTNDSNVEDPVQKVDKVLEQEEALIKKEEPVEAPDDTSKAEREDQESSALAPRTTADYSEGESFDNDIEVEEPLNEVEVHVDDPVEAPGGVDFAIETPREASCFDETTHHPEAVDLEKSPDDVLEAAVEKAEAYNEMEGEYDQDYDTSELIDSEDLEALQASEAHDAVVESILAEAAIEEPAQVHALESVEDTKVEALEADEGWSESKTEGKAEELQASESMHAEDRNRDREEPEEIATSASAFDEMVEKDAISESEEEQVESLMKAVVSPVVGVVDEADFLECNNLHQTMVQKFETEELVPSPPKPLESQLATPEPEVIAMMESTLSKLSELNSVEASHIEENDQHVDDNGSTLPSSGEEVFAPATSTNEASNGDEPLTDTLLMPLDDRSSSYSDQETHKESEQEEPAYAADVLEYANEYDEGFEEDALESTHEAEDFVTESVTQESSSLHKVPAIPPSDDEEMYDDADNFE
uniref:Uncharacterized protein AlNc14C26G2557 n=1 Tax=Albugo laibachii Nc14 TaxID=890382 RepID=F0W6S1_9STRA|nr:conserved hypothetical protein [Albugo laibachii Nc14]|eukprot:CCA16816.1 conserved hypothetical protein [Albugo laibachii Nc14]